MSELSQLMKESKGLPSAFRKTHPVGTVWAGKVDRVAVTQVRDDDGVLETWDDGNAKQQVIIAIHTDQRDPDKPGDDGIRGIYVKWWGEQRKAFVECLRVAGVEDVEVGGMFAAQYSGDGPQPTNRMFSPAKLMKYEYRPPSGMAGLINGPASNGAAPAAAPAAAAPPAPPAPPGDPWGGAGPTPNGAAGMFGVGQANAAAAAQPPSFGHASGPGTAAGNAGRAPDAASFFGAPAAPDVLADLWGATPPAAAPQAPAAAAPAPPAAATQAAPAAAPTDPMALLTQIKGLIALGMTDEQIGAATGANANALAAVRALPA